MRTRARLRRGVYILPSLFTTGNLLCGYIAVVRSLQGDYYWAAIAVFIAALLDRFENLVAPLVHMRVRGQRERGAAAGPMTFLAVLLQ